MCPDPSYYTWMVAFLLGFSGAVLSSLRARKKQPRQVLQATRRCPNQPGHDSTRCPLAESWS